MGAVARLALGGTGVGDRSAMVLAVLLTACGWLAARLVGGPRVAFGVSVVGMALFGLAALPPRNPPPYDDVRALYTTEQAIQVQLAAPAGAGADAVLSVLAQPVFAGAQPRFGLAADLNGTSAAWNCAFGRGIQRLALTLPLGTLAQATAEVRLRLTGAPSRDGDYLLVYSSARNGGFLISIGPAASVDPAAIHCALA
jgi:hypothetical protein